MGERVGQLTLTWSYLGSDLRELKMDKLAPAGKSAICSARWVVSSKASSCLRHGCFLRVVDLAEI